MAAKAILGDDERCDKFRTRPPWVSRSVTNSVLLGIVAEIVDNVGFPIGSTMRRIGRVKGRFPIGEFRMLLVKRFEIMNGGIGRDRLRIELFILKPIKDGSNLLRGIVTNGLRALHEQVRLFAESPLSFPPERWVQPQKQKAQSQSSDSQEHKIELSSIPIRPTSTTPAYQAIIPNQFRTRN